LGSNSSVPVQQVTYLRLKPGDPVSHSNEDAGWRHMDEYSTYAVGCITHVIDLRLGEEIHFIVQGLKKAFLERTWLKAQLTACLAVVAKVS
jgi:hypothetical protein